MNRLEMEEQKIVKKRKLIKKRIYKDENIRGVLNISELG